MESPNQQKVDADSEVRRVKSCPCPCQGIDGGSLWSLVHNAFEGSKSTPPKKDTFASFDIQSTDVVLAVDMNIHAEITPQCYSTVQ
jgi:hypothetical protein